MTEKIVPYRSSDAPKLVGSHSALYCTNVLTYSFDSTLFECPQYLRTNNNCHRYSSHGLLMKNTHETNYSVASSEIVPGTMFIECRSTSLCVFTDTGQRDKVGRPFLTSLFNSSAFIMFQSPLSI